MSFRAFLQSQGLSEKDIDEVIEEARNATEVAHSVSGMVSGFLQVRMQRTENEKVKKLLGIGATIAGKVHDGSAELLKKR
jgi:ribosomal protein L12E/L44/L45/RPP1/RPP2